MLIYYRITITNKILKLKKKFEIIKNILYIIGSELLYKNKIR